MRGRILAACLVILGSAILVAGGGAGNRVGTPGLVATSAVTYGQDVAYTATFTNDGNSTFTHVTFKMQPPAVPGTSLRATNPRTSSSSCAVDASGALSCDLGQLRSKQKATLVVVWKTPGDISLQGCADCLVADSTWLINENKPTNSNETFTASEKVGLLGSSSDPALSARQRASGYQLAGCTGSTKSSLSTDQALDAANNPVTTSFCIPASFVAGIANGLLSAILEPSKTSKDYAHRSDVCVAQPGQDCDNPDYLPQDFSPDKLTFTFRVAAGALPKYYEIKTVSHNDGAPVKEGKCDSTGFCVLSIDPPTKKNPVWTIVVTATTNGHFNW